MSEKFPANESMPAPAESNSESTEPVAETENIGEKESPLEFAIKNAEQIADKNKRNTTFFGIGKDAIGSGNFELAKELIEKIGADKQLLKFRLAMEVARRSNNAGDFELALANADEVAPGAEGKSGAHDIAVLEVAIWAARAKNEGFANEAIKKIMEPGMLSRASLEIKTILETGKGTWTESGPYKGLEL
jgi:hypothetical protein